MIMAGLRGVGKTTLLAQLYLHPKLKSATKFYLSLDQAQLIGAGMDDVVVALEAKLGHPLAQADKPIFVFLDEVHSLPKWSLAAKILYDRCPRLFLICTSSSALALRTTPDIARRAQFIRIGPLSLPEVVFINATHAIDTAHMHGYIDNDPINPDNLRPNIALGGKIQAALFNSETAAEAYNRLKDIEPEINLYWRQQNANQAIKNYVTNYETLPYILVIKQKREPGEAEPTNEIRVSIRQTLEKVYNHDLAIVGQFDQSTRQHFPSLLLWLANSTQQSLTKMAQRMGLNIRTLQNMFEVLVNSEILIAIPPFGSSSGKIAKPYKYLFMAPAIRQALNNLAASQSTETQLDRLKGSLLEDTVGFYLKQNFSNQPLGGLVEYDSSQTGADFVVLPTHIKTEAIALEVGWQKRTSQQVQSTLARTKSNRYGLVVTDCKLKLNESERAIFVPLKIFLLMQPQGLPDAQSLNLNPDRPIVGGDTDDTLPEDIPS